MTRSLADMRRDYTREGLSEAVAPHDPFILFDKWFSEAMITEHEPVEANAMMLATVDTAGRPHCRVLLLKVLDSRGFTFFSNYESDKGCQLDANPYAAMTFFWPTLERQVRIEGIVERTSAEDSEAYYQVRPLGSRLGAWASPQSRVLKDRAELEQLVAHTEQRFAEEPLHCPPHWGGYRLLPERMEFWQGRPSRLHDRLNYQRSGVEAAHWVMARLAP